MFFGGGGLIRLLVWSFSPSTHDARCYSSHCVCSHNICHKCSLCNRNSQSGLPPSCLPPPHSIYRQISTVNIFTLLASTLTSFFFFWHLVILMCFIKTAWGLIPDLCRLLAASVYSGNHNGTVCPHLDRRVCLSFLTSARSTDCFSPSCFSPFTQIPVISADHLTSHKYVTQM